MKYLVMSCRGHVPVAAIHNPPLQGKVKQVVEVIDHEISKRKQYRTIAVRRHLEFDRNKHLRLLCRPGFLEVVPGREGKKGWRFQRQVWPPPVEFTVGLAYCLSGGVTKQYNLRPEMKPQVERRPKNYQDLKTPLAAICELNHVLIRPEE
jgi:hypothetical protein